MDSRDLAERARLGLAYAASWVAFSTEGTPRPFSASFAVTNRCNLLCSYCNFPLLDPSELDLDAIARLFDHLRDLGVVRLGLVGGEPLVRKDIESIVALARARRFFVSMNSNLTLYARFPHVFADVALVLTSIDGTAETHVRNRGLRAFDGVLEAIADLRRREKRVVAICVVNEETVDQASALLTTADELDIAVHFQPQCVDTAIVRGRPSAELTNERLRAFWRRLLDDKRAGRPIASSSAYLAALARWDDFGISALATPTGRCAAGRGFFFIDPKGDAYPCAYTKGKTPPVNLLRDDWRTAWSRETPCNTCSVGPMLEFNLLFRRPIASTLDLARTYLRR